MYSSENSEEVLNEMLKAIPDTYAKTIGFPVYDITASFAIEAAKIYKEAEDIKAKLDVENLSGEELTRRVYQLTGVERREAVKAVGFVTVTGTGTVPIGTIFSTENNIQFITIKKAEVVESGKIEIEAVAAGPEGNVGTGSITKIPVKIPGITAVINEEPTRNGYIEETDKELLQRFYDDLQKPVVSGNKAHYEKWALEMAGVGAAKCFSLAFGPNTVEVCIVGNDGRAATSELIENVQNYIDPNSSGLGEGEAPAGAYCTVTTASEVEINITATVVLAQSYEVQAVQTAVKEEVTKLLKEKAFNSDYISMAQIGNIIFTTPGVLDYSHLQLNGSGANISIGEREVAVLGTVVLSE